uniref:A-kinase anchor protein 7-like phosphoesterase domain-containing protein n=1 Tax=Timema bartmani TaxID=61472 RepID=A0A7R9HXX1_9NEOP|nr:unnamed protein product [Timema bartmani]
MDPRATTSSIENENENLVNDEAANEHPNNTKADSIDLSPHTAAPFTSNKSHYSSRRKIKQLPVILGIDGVSRVTCHHPWSPGCIGTLRDYSDVSTLDHVIANATINCFGAVFVAGKMETKRFNGRMLDKRQISHDRDVSDSSSRSCHVGMRWGPFSRRHNVPPTIIQTQLAILRNSLMILKWKLQKLEDLEHLFMFLARANQSIASSLRCNIRVLYKFEACFGLLSILAFVVNRLDLQAALLRQTLAPQFWLSEVTTDKHMFLQIIWFGGRIHSYFSKLSEVSCELSVSTTKDKIENNILETCSDRNVEESIFQNPDKLHLTIGTLILSSTVERNKAAEILQESKELIIDPLLQGAALKVQMVGLEYMNDDPAEVDVLYGKVNVQDHSSLLQQLADNLVDFFTSQGKSFW